jgi:Mg2+/Co2+ transporter CorB
MTNDLQLLIFAIALILLIGLAAFFSCAETGLMAANRYRLRHKARHKKRYAMRLLKLLKRPDRLLAAILIGNTFANMIASSLATLLAYHFWGDEGALLAAIALTLIVLIFAEITPKTLAALYPDQVARFVALPIQIVIWMIYPIVWFANLVSNSLLRLLRIQVTTYANEPFSREELRSMVYETAGKISRRYQNMLLSILDLSKLTVDDVMISRDEIKGIDIEAAFTSIVSQLHSVHQEWVPFYRENINHIVGVLYISDLLKLFLSKQQLDADVLQQFLREPYFVPEGTSLNIQLGYFQKHKDKVAFVVNEYGELQGVLTLNDILEEIVGDFTTSVTRIKQIDGQADGSYLVDGTITVREFNRSTEWELPLEGPKTINGLIVEYLQAMPHAGTTVLIAQYPIEIVQVKLNRVKLARVFPRLS